MMDISSRQYQPVQNCTFPVPLRAAHLVYTDKARQCAAGACCLDTSFPRMLSPQRRSCHRDPGNASASVPPHGCSAAVSV